MVCGGRPDSALAEDSKQGLLLSSGPSSIARYRLMQRISVHVYTSLYSDIANDSFQATWRSSACLIVERRA